MARYYQATPSRLMRSCTKTCCAFVALYRQLVEANDHLVDADTLSDDVKDESNGADPAVEAKRLRRDLRAERNPKLIKDAKRIHGSTCAVCAFNRDLRRLGEGYIEAHHLTPFAELEGRPTKLDPRKDFAVVCASCHRMLHRR